MYNDDEENKTVAFWGAFGPSAAKKEEPAAPVEPVATAAEAAPVEPVASAATVEPVVPAEPVAAAEPAKMSIKDAIKEAVKAAEAAPAPAMNQEPEDAEAVNVLPEPAAEADAVAALEVNASQESVVMPNTAAWMQNNPDEEDDSEIDLFSIVPKAEKTAPEPAVAPSDDDDDEDEGKTVAIWELMRPSRKAENTSSSSDAGETVNTYGSSAGASAVNNSAAAMGSTPANSPSPFVDRRAENAQAFSAGSGMAGTHERTVTIEASAEHRASVEQFQRSMQGMNGSVTPQTAGNETEETAAGKKKKKGGFWSRLFGKKK